ncbi:MULTISPECIES: type II toxin-antitoxin system RelE/ParE family toxin [unclassified Duganella]|uniref:type II toxin-antitoxin system RelE/ParE family toxin n=1 Tax=unclassified Duganella TaxID=2636909 RepID=UPI000B7FB67A
MSSLIWSAAALSDVQRLYRFPAPKSQTAAKQAVAAIRRAVRWLQAYPHLGKRTFHLGPGHRQLAVPFGAEGYVVFYVVSGGVVTILAVKHQRECAP